MAATRMRSSPRPNESVLSGTPAVSEEAGKQRTRVRAAALAALARREHGFRELQDKLCERFPDLDPQGLILPVLEELRDAGLQSDSRFLENFVRYRSQRGCGPLKVAAELRPRGLDAGSIEAALRDGQVDWFAECRRALHKKLAASRLAGPLEGAARQRVQRFLLQRGFTHEQVGEALKSLKDQAL